MRSTKSSLLEDVAKLKFIANVQRTVEIRNMINLTRSAFSRPQSCPWSQREISLRTKDRVYQAVVRSILLDGCETWPVRVADERMLEVFDNGSSTMVELQRRLVLTYIPAELIQRGLRWFGRVARRPNGAQIRGFLLPTPPVVLRPPRNPPRSSKSQTCARQLACVKRVFLCMIYYGRWRAIDKSIL